MAGLAVCPAIPRHRRQVNCFDILEDSRGLVGEETLVPAGAQSVLEELSVDHGLNQRPAHGLSKTSRGDENFTKTSTKLGQKACSKHGQTAHPTLRPGQFEPIGLRNENINQDMLFEQQHPLSFVEPVQSTQEQLEKHLAATPLPGHAFHSPEQKNVKMMHEEPTLPSTPPPNYFSTPVKVSGRVAVDDLPASPALSAVSELGSSFYECSSPAIASSPRIEDSLAELDKLEDDLEAFNAVTNGKRAGSPDKKTSNGVTGSAIKKRVSIAGASATVRVKSSEKARPSLRRSASLNLREKNARTLEPMIEQKADASLSRSKSTNFRAVSAKAPVKSTKPVTVPNFELPGEAVARRLKEQREARLAQQAEAQTAASVPQRIRSNKPLTRPTFELPGEAISRRKREEREARLRAQEEEEKRRREFKARPMRQNAVPSTLPRETVTSRARQKKPQVEQQPENSTDVGRQKRLSVGPHRAPINAYNSIEYPPRRGRASLTLPNEHVARANSTSTGSVSGQLSTISSEEAAQMRLRGREVFVRDNSYSQDREREKRERENATKLARQEAAERSRAASREWAEKKRLRELRER